MSYYARKFGTDRDGECDMRAEAEYLTRSNLEPDECHACFQTDCVCPTLPLDVQPTYGMCTGCGSVEVRLNNVTGHRDLSDIGEHERYPTGYGCEVCA